MNKHSHNHEKKSSRKAATIVCVLLVLAVIAALGIYLAQASRSRREPETLSPQLSSPAPTFTPGPTPDPTPEPTPESTPEPTPEPVPIPVNFEKLQSINSDIMGWIEVEGTNVDYPIVYDASDDNYYLTHTHRGEYSLNGSIFIQNYNCADLTDFNTVVYGHNMADGSMFATLHSFKDSDFFAENDTIIVYTPDRKLTYEIFAAYRTDNLHILFTYSFDTPEDREAYIDHIYSHSEIARFDEDVTVTEADKIITLSTCIGDERYRYVIQGVLISDEPGIQEAE